MRRNLLTLRTTVANLRRCASTEPAGEAYDPVPESTNPGPLRYDKVLHTVVLIEVFGPNNWV